MKPSEKIISFSVESYLEKKKVLWEEIVTKVPAHARAPLSCTQVAGCCNMKNINQKNLKRDFSFFSADFSSFVSISKITKNK